MESIKGFRKREDVVVDAADTLPVELKGDVAIQPRTWAIDVMTTRSCGETLIMYSIAMYLYIDL